VTLAELLAGVRVDGTTKGFPPVDEPVALADVQGRGWTFEDLGAPVLLLRADAIEHNVSLMARYCADHGVQLAPHGKTTMSPQLWDRQLRAGAWGLTAATVQQARVMAAAGVDRILIANEVVDPEGIAWLARRLRDPGVELLCYVDSEDGAAKVDEELVREGAGRPLDVLVDVGYPGGRTGARTVAAALAISAAVERSSRLRLAGASAFEGTIGRDREPGTIDAIRRHLDDLAAVADGIGGLVDGDPVVSAGGSAYFDLVVERFAGHPRVVLRSGCYVTHDDARYERLSPFGDEPWERRFHPAIEIWGTVLSRPEPDLAIVGFGKRDVPFDEELPIPRTVRAPSGATTDVRGGIAVTALNDQHAYCRVDESVPLRVGDLLCCGISHPCTAFDRWRVIPMLDADDRVVEAIATYF
jgi:D-serine dehydratase